MIQKLTDNGNWYFTTLRCFIPLRKVYHPTHVLQPIRSNSLTFKNGKASICVSLGLIPTGMKWILIYLMIYALKMFQLNFCRVNSQASSKLLFYLAKNHEFCLFLMQSNLMRFSSGVPTAGRESALMSASMWTLNETIIATRYY